MSSIEDIYWTIGCSAWPLMVGTGVGFTLSPLRHRPEFKAARILFLSSGVGPLLATAYWAYAHNPSLREIAMVAGFVGAIIGLITIELCRWLDERENEFYKNKDDSQ
jgi:hypothetical protein